MLLSSQRPLLALLGFAALSGCVTVNLSTAQTPQAGAGLEPGDRVVAMWKDAFYDATVITVQGKLVTVAWDVPPPDESRVPRGWVQRLDAQPQELERSRWMLCPGETAWQLCFMQTAQQDRITALSAQDGQVRTWPIADVLELPEEVQGWAERHGHRVLEYLAFEQRMSTLSPATAGQPVVPEATVMARWQDGNWWSGRVTTVGELGITVSWADGSEDSVLRSADVAPLPQEPTAFEVGDLAFCLWQGNARWWQARIDHVGQGRLEVTYADATVEVLAADRCVPARQAAVP